MNRNQLRPEKQSTRFKITVQANIKVEYGVSCSIEICSFPVCRSDFYYSSRIIRTLICGQFVIDFTCEFLSFESFDHDAESKKPGTKCQIEHQKFCTQSGGEWETFRQNSDCQSWRDRMQSHEDC